MQPELPEALGILGLTVDSVGALLIAWPIARRGRSEARDIAAPNPGDVRVERRDGELRYEGPAIDVLMAEKRYALLGGFLLAIGFMLQIAAHLSR
jgi:hypothetical protein